MKKVLLAAAILMTGCTSKTPVCDVAKKASSIVATQVATQLACKNQAAIEESLTELLVKANVCTATAQGPIGELVCPIMVTGLLDGALKQIPAKWECSGGELKEDARAKLLEFCKKSI